jgi:hypothetical protein
MQMTDVVLVPTFNRPEYLWLCLEHLAHAEGAASKHIRIAHDSHINDAGDVRANYQLTREVVEKYQAGTDFASVSLQYRQPHHYIGNPLNFFELYKDAYNDPNLRYVYLVEDDVLVSPDFFSWHEAVQARSDYFVTVGWHCVRRPGPIQNDDPTEYIESTMDYSSIGVCWKREKLEAVVRHATPLYYRDHRTYMLQAFRGNRIPAGQWTEQAGVITRLLHETGNRWVAWPTRRRCSHVGVSGYHRPHGFRFTGQLHDRVEALRRAVQDSAIVGMNKDFGGDIEPVLPAKDWQPEQLHVVQRFPYDGTIG